MRPSADIEKNVRRGRRRLMVILAIALAIAAEPMAKAATRHRDVASLNQNSREIFATAMEWGDRAWESAASLEKAPTPAAGDVHAQEIAGHRMVRESGWYALGLLLRDQKGDRERAAAAIHAVLSQQYVDPKTRWYGTFRRYPGEPEPGADSKPGIEYDPNWREFVGTTLAIILIEYPERVPKALAAEMQTAISRAVEGEAKEGRLKPNYTNIALMYGFLLDYAAATDGHAAWEHSAAEWRQSVYRLFQPHESFEEYNSPTYTGVDLYALALWRNYGSTANMRSMGETMEAAVWRTTADFYNASQKNLAGPFDRSYGMDMQDYVSVLGLWLRTVLPSAQAPLPNIEANVVDHVGDLWIVPALVVLDAKIPADALAKFRAFSGEHAVLHAITDQRTATAWIGSRVMYGGESTGRTLGVEERSQFHPMTMHWKMTDEKIGWVKLLRCPPVDVVAEKGKIALTASGDVMFRMRAAGLDATALRRGRWMLPGLNVGVETDAATFHAENHGGVVDVTYTKLTSIVLRPE
jgi:hypothetical protein